MITILSPLSKLIQQLRSEAALIPPERKLLLEQFAEYIRTNKEGDIYLNFICTHNSRRSHLAMIWAAVAADVFALPPNTGPSGQVHTYSGGTEATAFNPRAVAALERAGFQVGNPGGDNPHYLIAYSVTRPPLECWSKTWDDPINPARNFAAIMTCSDADENCPFIPGVNLRLALTYEDPKVADDTPAEVQKYDERLRQIGREILYAFSLI